MRCLLVLLAFGCVEPSYYGRPYHAACTDVPLDEMPEECGTPCELYCCALLTHCADVILLTASKCLERCEAIPQDGENGDLQGNTLQCRMSYALRSAEDGQFCQYATPWSMSACGDD